MVAIKTHEADSFLRKPAAAMAAFLIYGGDAGLVSDRAKSLAATLAARDNPPGDIIRIEDQDLEDDSGRLAVELQTIAMFGGRKIVRTQTSRRVTVLTLTPLLTGPQLEGYLIVEAGSLKPDDKVRQLFEKSDRAAAIACFSDPEKDADTLISQVLGQFKLTIDNDARKSLIARLAGDRAAARSEIEKLALFAHGRPTITLDDVEQAIGDAREQAIDQVVGSAMAGRLREALGDCDRAVAGGECAQAIVAAAQRHVQRLHRVKLAIESGKSIDDALRALRPPLFGKQRDAVLADVRAWSAEGLTQALARIAATQSATRKTGANEDVLTERLLMELAYLSPAGRTRGR